MIHPEVTFGIPAYNSESHLALSIDSLLAQTYPAVHILISDNASTDSTEAIGREYAEKYPNITYIRQPTNIGAAQNFQYLQRTAKTPYFAWAGSHDLWHPEFTARMVEHLESNPSVVLAYPRTSYIDLEGKELSIDHVSLDTVGLTRIGSYRKILWQLHSCYLIHGVLRQSSLPVLRFPCVISGDHVTIAEIGFHGEIAFIDNVLFYARVIRPDEVMGSEQYYRRVMKAITGDAVVDDYESDKMRLKRELRACHLDLINNSNLTFGERMLARWQTYYCFDTRWQVPAGPLHFIYFILKKVVPEKLRLRVTGRLLR